MTDYINYEMTYFLPRQPDVQALDPPDESVFYPRDNVQPAATGDYLFLAAMLKNWDDPAGHLAVYGKPVPECVFINSANDYRHPVSGVQMDAPGREPLFLLKRKTVAGYFRKSYFMIRRILGSTNLHLYDQTIIIGDLLILKEIIDETGPEWTRYSFPTESTFQVCHENLAFLNLSLKFKLEDEDFRNNFRTLSIPDLNNLKAGPGQAVCPFDGVVVPVTGKISSPRWTWHSLCGREYEGLLCPHCLGVVSPFRLGRMS